MMSSQQEINTEENQTQSKIVNHQSFGTVNRGKRKPQMEKPGALNPKHSAEENCAADGPGDCRTRPVLKRKARQ